MATGGTSEDSFIEVYDLLEDNSDEENETSDEENETSDEENELYENFNHLSLEEQHIFPRLRERQHLLQRLVPEVNKRHATLLGILENRLSSHRVIEVFYHVTDVTAKEKIQRQGKLVANVSHQPTSKTASPIDKLEIKGVHFRLNLHRNRDCLPIDSPFGTERVSIPISNLSEYELFFNHYNRCNPKTSGGHEVYYISLVLVKPSDDDYDDIKKVLKKLDPKENDFVYFDHKNRTYRYYDFYKLNELQPGKKRRRAFNVYYEIAVIGDVLFPVWDSVTKR